MRCAWSRRLCASAEPPTFTPEIHSFLSENIMSEERVRLDDLHLRYPALFPKGPLMWGFEHGEGWTDLVAGLCQDIDTSLRQDPGARFRVKQVKEKFGALRFYYELHDASD